MALIGWNGGVATTPFEDGFTRGRGMQDFREPLLHVSLRIRGWSGILILVGGSFGATSRSATLEVVDGCTELTFLKWNLFARKEIHKAARLHTKRC